MKHLPLIAALFLSISISSLGHAADCELTTKGKVPSVIKVPLTIQYEEHSPVGSGTATAEGIEIDFESGWAGVSDERGATEKYVFRTFSVYKGVVELGEKDVAEGEAFELKISDPKIAKVLCRL